MNQHRKAGEQLAQFPSEEITYNLKVGMWETGGAYEIWEMTFKEGVEVGYHEHHISNETFMVMEGSIEVVITNNKFIAHAGDTVHVPPYMPHSMVFLEPTKMISFFNNYQFYNAMQERTQIKELNPTAFENPEFAQSFRERFDSFQMKTPEQLAEESKPKE